MAQNITQLTADNFEQTTQRQDSIPVLVDFWAPWCAPCRAMEPVLEDLANELQGSAIIAKVNVDDEPTLANAARVHAIPTLVLYRNAEVADVMVGMQSKHQLRAKLLDQ